MAQPSGLKTHNLIAPALTPFDETGRPDHARFVAHAKWLLEEGCTGLAPFGTTSEANSLGLQERKQLLESLVEAGISPAKLIPGTGCCAVEDTVQLMRHALGLGVAGALVLPPFYYKGVSDEGLFAHFAQVIEGVGDDRMKIYLYHIPPIAQVGFTLDLIGRLADAFPKTIVGLKDSSGDWENTKSIIEAFPQLKIYSGSELAMLKCLRAGGAGVISATANVNAVGLRALLDGFEGTKADALQAAASAIRKAVQQRPLIPALKAIISHYRDDPLWAAPRPPLIALDDQAADALISELLVDYGFSLDIG
jgi:4-hydroxy-tetrahydrodipicolinate synthase